MPITHQAPGISVHHPCRKVVSDALWIRTRGGISLQEKDSMKIATWDWLTKLSEMEAPKQLQSPKVGLGARNGGLIWGESLVPFAQRTHKGEMSIPVRSARCFCGAD